MSAVYFLKGRRQHLRSRLACSPNPWVITAFIASCSNTSGILRHAARSGVKFDKDKIDRIVSDVRDEAHLNARHATQGKYELELVKL